MTQQAIPYTARSRVPRKDFPPSQISTR